MNKPENATREQFSRRTMLKGTGAMGAGLLLTEIALLCPEARRKRQPAWTSQLRRRAERQSAFRTSLTSW